MRKIFILVLSFALLITVITLFSNKQETEMSLTLYEASVTRVEESISVDGTYASIYTHEFDSPLYVTPQVYSICGDKILEQLHPQDKIRFKIHRSIDLTQETLSFILIMELTTENQIIFSLDDYDAAMAATWDIIQIVKIAACVLIGVAVLLLLFGKNKDCKIVAEPRKR